MKNKYYIPKINEFHEGFLYERYDTIEGKSGVPLWIECVASAGFGAFDDDIYMLDDELIRVKHLNREDIESLGFVEEKLSKHAYIDDISYTKGHYLSDRYYALWHSRRDCRCYISLEALNPNNSSVLFNGVINNKSELVKVLKMIGVNDCSK